MKTPLALALACTLFATGCASSSKHKEHTAPALPPGSSLSPPSPPPASLMASSANPVWVLPAFQTGYVPGKVDPNTGEYVGGHNRETITTPGHWAAQEEATLAGAPYVIPSSNEVIDPRNKTTGASSGRAGTLNVALTQPPVVDNKDASVPPRPTPAPVVTVTTKKTVAIVKPSPTPKKAPAPEPAKVIAKATPKPATPEPVKVVAKVAPMPDLPKLPSATVAKSDFLVEHPNDKQIVFGGGRAGETHSITLPSGKEMTIHYVSDTKLEVGVAGGAAKEVSLPRLGAQVKLSVD